MPLRTPETLTAAERARRLGLAQKTDGLNPAMNASSTLSKSEAKVLAKARATLPSLESSIPSATAGIDPRLDADQSFIMLPIDEIVTYEHNPRTGLNPNYDQIKASIRADGITNMLTVTRRDPHAKYTVYGGGNTRLKIAKELYAEGDQRFAVLRVVYKEWPGDAQVISAHLAENENRGDISFWEKAQGVAAFQQELERESKRVYTTRELHAELRRRGLNYGMRMLQNFAFSVAEFEPVGRWLETKLVNERLRPVFGDLIDLADKLSESDAMRAALRVVLETHGQVLATVQRRNDNSDPEDRVAVAIDEPALLRDLQQSAASALDVDVAALGAMQRALAANARATADDLRAAAAARPAPVTGSDEGTPAHTALPAAPAGVPADAPPVPEQAPLGAMLAQVPSGNPLEPRAADPQAQLQGRMHALLAEINGFVPIADVVLSAPDQPFFYVMDLPPGDLAHFEGESLDADEAAAREAVWQALAIASCQFDGRVAAMLLKDPHSRWSAALKAGPEAFMATCAERVNLRFERGDFRLGIGAFARTLALPSVGSVFVRLLACTDEIRRRLPVRVPLGYAPTFAEKPDNP